MANSRRLTIEVVLMTKTILLFAACWLMTNVAFAQPKPNGKPQMKTVRLHIDGFSKSKSGAV